MITRRFLLTTGYLPGIDYPHPWEPLIDRFVRDQQLTSRFALVLDSTNSEIDWHYFDDTLCLALIKAVVDCIPHDKMVISWLKRPKEFLKLYPSKTDQWVGKGYFESFEALAAEHEKTPRNEDEPCHDLFECALLLKNNVPTGLIVYEPYASVGGPAPYSDRDVFAVYTNQPDMNALEIAFNAICTSLPAERLPDINGECTTLAAACDHPLSRKEERRRLLKSLEFPLMFLLALLLGLLYKLYS